MTESQLKKCQDCDAELGEQPLSNLCPTCEYTLFEREKYTCSECKLRQSHLLCDGCARSMCVHHMLRVVCLSWGLKQVCPQCELEHSVCPDCNDIIW
jgi:hypothetical protein